MSLFGEMEDEEVVRVLTSINGLGRWTAEMFLIFYLGSFQSRPGSSWTVSK
jgi:3-methyladenine DNA glycosylase/8-oxoguanine DNA glycosylase